MSQQRTVPSATVLERLPLALALAFALLAAGLGASQLGDVPTDPYSERISLAEAREMAAGNHRYGIVEYTHFPNGPIYAVAMMTGLGLEEAGMRYLPLLLTSASAGILLWILLAATRSRVLQAWAVIGLATIVVQPSFAGWMGALHEHAYVVALTCLAAALALRLPQQRTWLLFPLGFVAGWVGYDWLAGQTVVLWILRLLQIQSLPGSRFGPALAEASLDALKFVSGAALAILSHVLQLALFFGGFEDAVRDLVGPAAARAGVTEAWSVDPEYYEFLQRLERKVPPALSRRMAQSGFVIDAPERLSMIAGMTRIFALTQYTALLGGVALLGVAVLGFGLSGQLRTRTLLPAQLPGWLGLTLFGIVGAGLASVIWIVLMPKHALHHTHLLPRHFIMGLVVLLALPILRGAGGACAERRDEPAWGRWIRSGAGYALVPLLTLALFGYTVASFS